MKLPLTIATCVLLLTACSEEDIETANFGSSFFKNQYNLVNATDVEIAFHMANTELDGDERNVREDKYRVKVLNAGDASTQITHEHNTNRQISFFVESVNKLGMLVQEKIKVKNDTDYHFIAMQGNNNSLNLKVLKKERSDHDNVFTVRLLAAAPMSVSVNDQAVTLKTGEVSNWYQVDECVGDIRIQEVAVDICNASFGRSYLLVVNNDGLKSLVLEY
ncbi:hypothetical protein [Pseudoalteromonas xiamenensis]